MTAGLVVAALLTGTAISVWQALEAQRARRLADRLLDNEKKQARSDAETQRSRAQRNFDRAVNRMTLLHSKFYSEALRDLPPETRRTLADDIVQFFEEIVTKSACTIPGGRASRRAEPQSGSDGASPSQNHERPFSKDENKITRLEKAMAYFHLGGIYGREGRPDKVVGAYKRATAILEALTTEYPLETVPWQELGQAHYLSGLQLLSTGHTVERDARMP